MGVRGLQTFMEKNGVCIEVDIPYEIEYYKRNCGRTPVIVVDAMACLKHFYRGLSWILGGQMKEYEERIYHFVQQFQSLGVHLVFFFDGPTAVEKLDEWKRRRYHRIETISELFDRLWNGESLQAVESNSDPVNPSGLSWFTSKIVGLLGCEVICSVAECDEEIAKYSWENECVAVLSQDSDFAIYDCGRYWSMQHLDVDTMTTCEYHRNELADVLGIPSDSLPLFASLMGNDLIPLDSLRDFHRRIRDGRRGPIAFYVSEFVARYPSGRALQRFLREIAQIAFNDAREWTVLNTSLESYRLNRRLDDPHLTVSQNNNWEQVLRMAFHFHRTQVLSGFFNIIFLQNYLCSNSLEDYRMDDLPMYRDCLLWLRKAIYGILLFEKPSSSRRILVKELITAGPGSIDDFTAVDGFTTLRARHPGLLALWNEQDKSLNRDRMRLLCCNAGFNTGLIYKVPRQYRLLVLALAYLLGEHPSKLASVEQWEVEAVVATAVSLPNYSASDLSDIDVRYVNIRCVRLYSLVMRTCGVMRLLNFCCGSPIPLHFTVPTYYQDGKLFHIMYESAEQNMSFPNFTSRKVISHFNVVMDALYS